MYRIHIPYGAFFYGELRHRVHVDITDELRQIVHDCAWEMHWLFEKTLLPKAEYGKHCEKCSLKEICMPKMEQCCMTASTYLKIICINEKTVEYIVCNNT